MAQQTPEQGGSGPVPATATKGAADLAFALSVYAPRRLAQLRALGRQARALGTRKPKR